MLLFFVCPKSTVRAVSFSLVKRENLVSVGELEVTGSPFPPRLLLVPVFGSFVCQYKSWPCGLFREGLFVWSIVNIKGEYICSDYAIY